MLPNHEQLSKLDLNRTQMNLDARNLYPSAMWDKKSVYPKIETRSAFEPQMKDIYLEAVNVQTFNQMVRVRILY